MLTTTSSASPSRRMTGQIATPADREWDATRQVFNLTTDLRPAAIALPHDVDDVVAAVRHAVAAGLRVAPQATGHNAGPLSTLEDTLVVDVRGLQDVSIDARARRVRIGAGVRWQGVVPQLSKLGLAALHGSSPLVGIAGYSLGGGMGWLARRHGLQANSVTAVELVTAEGRAARVDAEHEPDLFWALRGGNGNFGVVTALEFAVHPVAELYAGAMFFPSARAEEVVHAWSELGPSLPDEMMTWASLLRFPDVRDVPEPLRGGAFTVVLGAFLGRAAEGGALLRPIRDLGPAIDTFATVPPAALADMAMDPPHPLPYDSTTALLRELPAVGVEKLVDAVRPGPDSPLAMVQLRQLGGALGRRAPGAGARATLPGSVIALALGVRADDDAAEAVSASLADLDRAMAPYAAGKYANFVEEAVDTSTFFDAETWTRLRAVKALYDPRDVFRGNHYIPPAQELP